MNLSSVFVRKAATLQLYLSVSGDLYFVVFVVGVDEVLCGVEWDVHPLESPQDVLLVRSGVVTLRLELWDPDAGRDDPGEAGVTLEVTAALNAEHQHRLATRLQKKDDFNV